jgi:hypothetical protein
MAKLARIDSVERAAVAASEEEEGCKSDDASFETRPPAAPQDDRI